MRSFFNSGSPMVAPRSLGQTGWVDLFTGAVSSYQAYQDQKKAEEQRKAAEAAARAAAAAATAQAQAMQAVLDLQRMEQEQQIIPGVPNIATIGLGALTVGSLIYLAVR